MKTSESKILSHESINFFEGLTDEMQTLIQRSGLKKKEIDQNPLEIAEMLRIRTGTKVFKRENLPSPEDVN